MEKPYYARVIYVGEGIELEKEFKTFAEAEACAKGFRMAKEILEAGDEDALDDYMFDVSQTPAVDE